MVSYRAPFSGFSATTLAPGPTPPSGSTTVPVIVPRSLCAKPPVVSPITNATTVRSVLAIFNPLTPYPSQLEAQAHPESHIALVVLAAYVIRTGNRPESIERQN